VCSCRCRFSSGRFSSELGDQSEQVRPHVYERGQKTHTHSSGVNYELQAYVPWKF
jgi:hypothetical protein